jgi:hypothetical protein
MPTHKFFAGLMTAVFFLSAELILFWLTEALTYGLHWWGWLTVVFDFYFIILFVKWAKEFYAYYTSW